MLRPRSESKFRLSVETMVLSNVDAWSDDDLYWRRTPKADVVDDEECFQSDWEVPNADDSVFKRSSKDATVVHDSLMLCMCMCGKRKELSQERQQEVPTNSTVCPP